jgi:hypothetical protein
VTIVDVFERRIVLESGAAQAAGQVAVFTFGY